MPAPLIEAHRVASLDRARRVGLELARGVRACEAVLMVGPLTAEDVARWEDEMLVVLRRARVEFDRVG